MARILDSVKSFAGKMMANPYDQPDQDVVKMSSTGEVRAYVPPVQQRVKRPDRQPTEQLGAATGTAMPPQQQMPEARQSFLGGLFRRGQQQEPQPYTGSQPSMSYTGNQPVYNASMTGQQQAVSSFTTMPNGRNAEVGGVKAFFGRVFGTSKMEPQPAQPQMGYTGQQPAGYTGQQQPMQGYTAQQRPAQGYTSQQPMQGYTAQQRPAQGYTSQQPMQGYTAQQRPAQGYTSQQPMQPQPGQQYTAQPAAYTAPQQPGQYFSGQQQVQHGAQRPVKGYFHGQTSQQPAASETPKAQPRTAQPNSWQQPQPQPVQQAPRPQPMPDNVSYMNAGNFVDEDGKSYAMVMRVAQPVGTATCYRIIEFIRNGEAVLVNTELITDPVELARSLDLLFGAAFAMHACYTRVAQRSLYLITPGSVKVTLYPSLNELHQRDNARHWPGSEADNHFDTSAQASQDYGYARERHRRTNRAY